MSELFDIKVKNGKAYILLRIEQTETEIKYYWREVVKNFAKQKLIKSKGWISLSDLLEPNEYPMDVEDIIEVYRKVKNE